MKNVCFFNSVHFWGGGEKLHLEYAVKFMQKNYTVYLATRKNSPLSEKGKENRLKVFNITVRNLSFLNPFKYIRLIRFYRKEQIDTVIFSASQDVKTGGFAASMAGVKNIVYLRGLAVPVKNSFINRFLFNHVLTHIVANSMETKRTILKHLNTSVSHNKVEVIYHGIELQDYSQDKTPTEQISSKRKEIILGNAGRLTPQKGQQHLIEIARCLKQRNIRFILHIAGTGEMRQSLEKQIDEYNLREEVILTGFVENIERFMKSLDIFLLTSEWEGFGYALVEAMACNIPAIAFDLSSNPEIMINGQTGFLIDFPDIEKFCDKIELLAKDKDLRLRMGKNGRETVEKKFQLADRVTEFEECLWGKGNR